MKAFVTGGSGFLGRHLISALLAKGWQVRALARSPQAADAVQRAGAGPVGLYPSTKALAEKRVLDANSPGLATVVVRPRFIWGGDGASVVANLVQRVRTGQWMWIDGGRYPTSTCNVENVCEGMILAAER